MFEAVNSHDSDGQRISNWKRLLSRARILRSLPGEKNFDWLGVQKGLKITFGEKFPKVHDLWSLAPVPTSATHFGVVFPRAWSVNVAPTYPWSLSQNTPVAHLIDFLLTELVLPALSFFLFLFSLSLSLCLFLFLSIFFFTRNFRNDKCNFYLCVFFGLLSLIKRWNTLERNIYCER